MTNRRRFAVTSGELQLMPEHQDHFSFADTSSTEPAVPSYLRDEIARTWSLPLGCRVEVSVHGQEHSAIVGVLELRSSPGYPWDPHEPLRLHINGFVFTNREIEHWVLV